jgi:hypothetical protein
VDLHRDSIDWCNANIARVHPNFRFIHFDLLDQLLGAAGPGVAPGAPPGWFPILILFTAPVLALAMTVQLNLTFSQPQGRYLFAALSAGAVLAASAWKASLCGSPPGRPESIL